jgi:hypothetical protein
MATPKRDSTLELVVEGYVLFSNYNNIRLDLEDITA